MNSAVFSLIKSLTKTEKRHFKVQAKTNPKNQNLVHLFDLIDRQDEYDENKIKSSIKEAQLLKHFAVNKTRLYDFILKTLRSYYASYNTPTHLLNQLTEIEILFSKKLYKECAKRIEKAKKTARDHGQSWILYKLNDWDEKIIKEQTEFLESSIEELSKIKTENEDILKVLKDSNAIKYHYYDLLLHSRNSVSRIETYKLNEIQSAIIRVNSNSLDHESYISYLNLNALYNHYINRHEESLTLYNKVVDFIESIPDGEQDFKQAHFLALNNVLSTQATCKQYAESGKTLKKIHDKYESQPAFEQEFNTLTFCHELSIHAETGNVTEAAPIIQKIEKNQKAFLNNDQNKYRFYYNIGTIKFYEQNFEDASKWIGMLISDYSYSQNNALSNLYYYSNILELILDYEKGNLNNLNSNIPKIKRTLLQIRPLNDVDIKVVNLLEGLTLAPIEKHRELFEKTKREMDYLLQLPHNPSIAQYFNISSWLSSKINTQPFHLLVQQKYKQHDV